MLEKLQCYDFTVILRTKHEHGKADALSRQLCREVYCKRCPEQENKEFVASGNKCAQEKMAVISILIICRSFMFIHGNSECKVADMGTKAVKNFPKR